MAITAAYDSYCDAQWFENALIYVLNITNEMSAINVDYHAFQRIDWMRDSMRMAGSMKKFLCGGCSSHSYIKSFKLLC